MFHATFEVPDGFEDIEFSVLNDSTGQDLGNYVVRSTTGSTDQVYASEDDIFSESEMDDEDAGTLPLFVIDQQVVIVQDESDSDTYHAYGIFDDVGTIKFKLQLGEGEYEVSHTLTADAEFADWIDYTSIWIEESVDFGGVVTTAATLTFPTPSSDTATLSEFSFSAAATTASSNPVVNRGIVAKALIFVFKGTVNPPISLFKGVFDGIKEGLKDDAAGLTGLAQFLASPYKRGSEIFQALKELSLSDIDNMITNALANLMNSADASITWTFDTTDVTDAFTVRAYVSGFVLGYTAEQVAVIISGAAIFAKAGQVVRSIMLATKTGTLVLSGVSAIQKFTGTILKFSTQKVKSIAELFKVRAMIKALKTTPVPNSVLNVAELLGQRYVNWASKVEAARKILNGAWDTLGEKAFTRLAEITNRLGPTIADKLTDKAVEGYFKAFGILQRNGIDETPRLINFYTKADNTLLKTELDNSFRALDDATDPIFYDRPDGTTMPTIGSAQGLIGEEFEEFLAKGFGGQSGFQAGGRNFDGAIGDIWYEAKSGDFWINRPEGSVEFNKFKSDMGDRLSIAQTNGKKYELYSNVPISDHAKAFLDEKGIEFFELLE